MFRFKNLYKRAFTLAEVLITLGIIGVVAALTIPSLIANTQISQIESQMKVDISTIQQAVKLVEGEGISYASVTIKDGDDTSMQDWFNTYMAPHIHMAQKCDNGVAGCWHKKGVVKTLDNSAPTYEQANSIGGNVITFTLQNGSMFDIDGVAPGDMYNIYAVTVPSDSLVFIFDANGAKPPNKIGKDIYSLVWTEDGLVPAGYSKTPEEVESNCLTGNGYWCLQYVKNNSWKINKKVWNRTI